MNGYVEAGYIVVLSSLIAYSARLLIRKRTLARLVGTGSPAPARDLQVGLDPDCL
ncbi:MAG: hypothetical protein ACYCS7_04040 [Acidimicrobiales bacterium]